MAKLKPVALPIAEFLALDFTLDACTVSTRAEPTRGTVRLGARHTLAVTCTLAITLEFTWTKPKVTKGIAMADVYYTNKDGVTVKELYPQVKLSGCTISTDNGKAISHGTYNTLMDCFLNGTNSVGYSWRTMVTSMAQPIGHLNPPTPMKG